MATVIAQYHLGKTTAQRAAKAKTLLRHLSQGEKNARCPLLAKRDRLTAGPKLTSPPRSSRYWSRATTGSQENSCPTFVAYSNSISERWGVSKTER